MRKALIVGIDDYDFAPLQAPERDAKMISDLLSSSEESNYNFACKLLRGSIDIVTENSLMAGLERLFLEGGANTDIALFYFAGHGDDKHGGTLVTQGASGRNLGVDIQRVLSMAKRSQARQKIIILDCCFAGQAGSMGIFDDGAAQISKEMIILAGAGADEKAVEIAGHGVFSKLLIDALKGAAADVLGNVTVANLYTHADRYLGPWNQRPYFKANISQMPILRKGEAEIDLKILKKLPDYFDLEDDLYPVSPEYDDEQEPHHPEKEAIFKDFRALHRVGLLVPEGADYLFHAARESAACKLTFKGQFYWKLVAAGRL